MARIASVQVGGYYPTPPAELAHIAQRLVVYKDSRSYTRLVIVDPCAGAGAALIDLGARLTSAYGVDAALYACELERERARRLERQLHGRALHGDAFNVDWGEKGCASLLFLNPPYDHDRRYGRLEHRFLLRFTDVLMARGVLVYIVPAATLEASAEHLATHYRDVYCHRFTNDNFSAFKQVVVLATKRDVPMPRPDERVMAQLLAWSKSPKKIIPLDQARTCVSVYLAEDRLTWQMVGVDVKGLQAAARPWMSGGNGRYQLVRNIGLEQDVTDLMHVQYPVVMPPRPVHVAIAMAAGLVNGQRVMPDDSDSGLPPIMVKGTFTREYHRIEEKTDKDGNVTKEVYVEQPKLNVTVLDMRDWRYYEIKAGTTPSGSSDLADMNIADLLAHYGMSLAEIMRAQCPPLHDPTDPAQMIELPPRFGMKPFDAQKHVIIANLKVLFTDRPPFAGENPIILGEVGVGKTLISLCIAACLSPRYFDETRRRLAAVGVSGGRVQPVRRVLVACPPHLLDTWSEEVAKALPEARVVTLSSLADVDAAATDDYPERTGNLLVMVVTREKAKLGHSWGAGVDKYGRCPSCGAPVGEDDPARKRLRCDHQPLLPANEWAVLASQFAPILARIDYGNHYASPFLQGRIFKRYLRKQSEAARRRVEKEEATWDEVWLETAAPPALPLAETLYGRFLDRLVDGLLARIKKGENRSQAVSDAKAFLPSAYMAFDHPERDAHLLATAQRLLAAVAADRGRYSNGAAARSLAAELALLVKDVDCPGQTELISRLSESDGWGDGVRLTNTWHRIRFERGLTDRAIDTFYAFDIHAQNGSIQYGGYSRRLELGSAKAAQALMENLYGRSEMQEGERCGAFLYQAASDLLRYPLADYIKERYPNMYDLFIADEVHEYKNLGTAQERAIHRLSENAPRSLGLTGTLSDGYAKGLFTNMWYFSRTFRNEFSLGDMQLFVDRYGYRKLVREIDEEERQKPQYVYGAVTDRIAGGYDDWNLRKAGDAPGVLPLFILKHLLPMATTIQKEDLDITLPDPEHEGVPIALDGDDPAASKIRQESERLWNETIRRIMDDLAEKSERAGLLWGAVAQLPTYGDRCHVDTGNYGPQGDRSYIVAYPERVGGEIVAVAEMLPADVLSPKEAWMIETVTREVAAGRPVIVLIMNTQSGLAARLERLIGEALGKKRVAYLSPSVSTSKRKAWIDKIIRQGVQVLIAHPKTIETGLNNLVYFATMIWMQNPNCSPIIYQQTVGRLHRPGQTQPVRSLMPYYEETAQEAQLSLLAHKISASRQVGGLDIAGALALAGAGEESDGIDSMSLGQAIYELMVRGDRNTGIFGRRSEPPRRPPMSKPARNGTHAAAKIEIPNGGVGTQLPLLQL